MARIIKIKYRPPARLEPIPVHLVCAEDWQSSCRLRLFRLEQEWMSNIPVVLAGLSVDVGAEVRSDSDLSAAVVGIAFVVVLEVGHR